MKKNDIFTAEITGISAEGNGVCRIDGQAVFVPNAAIGDIAQIRIVKLLKNYAFGKIESISTPSPSRIEPDCRCFLQCGGCVYRHISYEEELSIKETRVRDALERIGGIKNPPMNPIIGAKKISGYRNKAQLPVGVGAQGGVEIGFYSLHSHRIIDCGECLLQPEVFNRAMKIFREFITLTDNEPYNETTHKGRVRHLYLRYAEATNELMVCPVVNAGGLKQEDVLLQMLKDGLPELKTLVINTNTAKTNVILGEKNRAVFGNGYIEDILCGKKFRISPLSFYQVNRAQTERLYTLAGEYAQLSGDETLLDLYCGTGTIGLTMADKCKRLIGVEIVPQAVEDAKINAERNNIKNAEFICANAAAAAKTLNKRGIQPDVIIVDPPRKGCSQELITTISEMSPTRVVYISCDPATLARDLKSFTTLGYTINKITPVDMFPRTSHVETVVLMSRK